MASKEQLKKVAYRCSQHEFSNNASMTSSIGTLGQIERSCENCVHFTNEHKCDINLTDEILTNMAMELDYKDLD
ncbi:hypothetical protein [Brassicibacter mesophilus]|uniref:hypothetical protein n=1 Tax=Brassicibacter mesophilus TaxID=745119 RepID=UPI003D190460